MKIKDVIATLEVFAPLPLQEEYDNAGLQVGVTEAEISGVVLCLDVTEEVLAEAVEKGCNMVVAHHPLLFRPLRRLGDSSQVERCVRFAVMHGITIYAAHTNLDNSQGGVNYEIASRLELQDTAFLLDGNQGGGSGIIGSLPHPMTATDFVARVKDVFSVECAMCNALLERPVSRVAVCGGAGDFLLSEAVRQGSDAFITGEVHYHQFFGLEQVIQVLAIGHYQSEQFTPCLLQRIINRAYPAIPTFVTKVNTNPILYL